MQAVETLRPLDRGPVYGSDTEGEGEHFCAEFEMRVDKTQELAMFEKRINLFGEGTIPVQVNGVVRVCGKIVGARQQSLEELFSKRAMKRAVGILNDHQHVLAPFFEILPSGRRLRNYKCKTKRFSNTFIPQSILLLNSRQSPHTHPNFV